MKRKSLPKDVIEQWPEVLNDIDIQAIPIPYLHSMRIIFKEGRVWDINIARHAKTHNIDDLEAHLQELIDSYEDAIEHIDFRLDVGRIKKDVINNTKKFLKNKKTKK